MKECMEDHDIYVAETIGVPDEGKVVVITVCRRCDQVAFHEKVIAARPGPLRLFREEKQEKT